MLRGLYKTGYMNTPQIKQIRFNLNEMKKSFSGFKTRICAIGNILEGDKLSMNQHKVYSVYPAGSLQSIQRWWYAESRKTTLKQLSVNFLEYMQFVDMCVDATRVHPLDPMYLELCYDNIEFQDTIRGGIQNLKKTYEKDAEHDEDAKKICKYLNVLLDTMVEFKSHVIRRAYRRLYHQKLAERLDETVLARTTVDGKDIEFSEVSTTVDVMSREGNTLEGTISESKESNESKEPSIHEVRKQPNSLEMLAIVYPGDSEELKKHAEAVERGDEETSSFYDSDEEQEYIQRIRRRMKSKEGNESHITSTQNTQTRYTHFSESMNSLDTPVRGASSSDDETI